MKLNTNKIKEKLKNIKAQDIKKIWYVYKDKIVTIILLVLIVITFWYTISLWLDTKDKYNEVQYNIKEIKKVTNKNIINFIKEQNLRSIYTIANTANILDSKYSVKKYKDVLWKLTVFLMYNDKTWNYKNKINEQVLHNTEDINSILNIDNKEDLSYSNYYKFIKSDYVNIYLSSLILKDIKLWDYKNKFNQDITKTLLKVIKNLDISELIFIEDNLKKENIEYNNIYNSYKYPYEKLLSYIFLPSVDIWKNKFSWKINVDVFWSEYLNKADFIDLNLMKYWSNYFISSYKSKWKLYQWEKNRIDNIWIWKFSLLKGTNITTLPITLNFWLNDDKSFYWLISKLTSTSDQKDIMIISEFTYYLWKNVKNNISSFIENNKSKHKTTIWQRYISELIHKCTQNPESFKKLNCWEVFGCNDYKKCSVEDFSSYNVIDDYSYNSLKDILLLNKNYTLEKSFIYKYNLNWYEDIDSIDTLLWARLYDCLIKDSYCTDIFYKDNDQFYWIKKTITDFAWCDGVNIDTNCKYKFINKFDTNYFIAYTMVDKLEWLKSYNYLDRLKDTYKNISWLLQIWKFTFKNKDNLFSTTNDVKYTSKSSLNVYYKYISNENVNDILNFLWKKRCYHVTNWKKWNLDIAYNYITWIKKNLYKNDISASWIYNINKIISILDGLKKDYNKKSNLEKLLANLQVYRILKERGDCQN